MRVNILPPFHLFGAFRITPFLLCYSISPKFKSVAGTRGLNFCGVLGAEERFVKPLHNEFLLKRLHAF